MIIVESKKKSLEKLSKVYPNAVILDVTSKAQMPWVKFSPFYPHGDIPVPNCSYQAMSVEGLWQGLKVFEHEDIDLKSFDNRTMKNIKRTVRKHGQVKGHRFGIGSNDILPYIEARFSIYLPAYGWILDNKLQDEIAEIKKIMQLNDVVLLDYETNTDPYNTSKPLSHAGLIQKYIQGEWPVRAIN
ncbi:DUF6939 family protein [Niastella caeni]|nr:hypothetical protein [Niastella caeni]